MSVYRQVDAHPLYGRPMNNESVQDHEHQRQLLVAVLAYDGMTALDAIGPFKVLRFLPGARVELVAATKGSIHTDSKQLTLTASANLDDILAPDVVVVPGGRGTAAAITGPIPAWLRRVHPGTKWTTSVCAGSHILGAAGLLTGLTATSHFAVLEHLQSFGAEPVTQRVVVQPSARIITAAGVSAGIDMALVLAGHLTDVTAAQAIQLILEYAPNPPYDSGALAGASSEVIDRAMDIGKPHGAIPAYWEP